MNRFMKCAVASVETRHAAIAGSKGNVLNGAHCRRVLGNDAVISRGLSDEAQPINSRRKNKALERVKAAGMSHLEATTREVAAKTRKPLLRSEEDDLPTPDQLSEGRRIFEHLNEALEQFSRNDKTFCIKGDPIVILDVEVSPDLKHARVYWALPYGLVGLPKKVADEITSRMQNILVKRGGKLQAIVHTRLRHYYPPRLRFVPAEDDAMRIALKELLGM